MVPWAANSERRGGTHPEGGSRRGPLSPRSAPRPEAWRERRRGAPSLQAPGSPRQRSRSALASRALLLSRLLPTAPVGGGAGSRASRWAPGVHSCSGLPPELRVRRRKTRRRAPPSRPPRQPAWARPRRGIQREEDQHCVCGCVVVCVCARVRAPVPGCACQREREREGKAGAAAGAARLKQLGRETGSENGSQARGLPGGAGEIPLPGPAGGA